MKPRDNVEELESICKIREILSGYKTYLATENKNKDNLNKNRKSMRLFSPTEDEIEFKNLSKAHRELQTKNKSLAVDILLKSLEDKGSTGKTLENFVRAFDKYKNNLEKRRQDAADPFFLYLIKKKIFEIIPVDYIPKSWRVTGGEISSQINAELNISKKLANK